MYGKPTFSTVTHKITHNNPRGWISRVILWLVFFSPWKTHAYVVGYFSRGGTYLPYRTVRYGMVRHNIQNSISHGKHEKVRRRRRHQRRQASRNFKTNHTSITIHRVVKDNEQEIDKGKDKSADKGINRQFHKGIDERAHDGRWEKDGALAMVKSSCALFSLGTICWFVVDLQAR